MLSRAPRRPQPRRRVPSIAVPPIYSPLFVRSIEVTTEYIDITISDAGFLQNTEIEAQVWTQIIPNPPEPGLPATGITQIAPNIFRLTFAGNPAINFYALELQQPTLAIRSPSGGYLAGGFFRPD